MKTLIVIAVFIGLFLLLYGCVRFTEWFNKKIDQYNFNNGICRLCGSKYVYITKDEHFTIFSCDHCANLIIVENDII